MLEYLIEHKKTINILLIISIIIIVAVIWWPEDDIELSYYNVLSEEDIDSSVTQEYGNELFEALYLGDMKLLNEKKSDEYLEYNAIQTGYYESWLRENGIFSNNITFNATKKYNYGDTVIYSVDATFSGNSKRINIIETYPEQWYYTFDTFVSFKDILRTVETEEYGATVNSIYQDLNYIQFDCSVFVNEKDKITLDISKSDSVKLIMKDKSSFIMATNNFSSESTLINGKEYINLKCIFNVPITSQSNISSVVFNTFNINNEVESLKINVSL